MNTKDKEVHGLDKLPDVAIIQSLQKFIGVLKVDAGKQTAYIQELEHKIEELKNPDNLSKLLGVQLKADKAYQTLMETCSSKTKQINKLKLDNEELVIKLIQLQKQLDEATRD